MSKYKFFVVADVHGFYDELKTALDNAGFDLNDPSHIFVSLGDIMDRGRQPAKVLNFVNNLPPSRKILVRGNHEDLMEEALDRRSFLNHDIHNGTALTAYDLYTHYAVPSNPDASSSTICNFVRYNCDPYSRYIHSLYPYFETANYVFVHGWIPYGDDWRNGNWEEARWINGMEHALEGHLVEGKTVVCGHWGTYWGHSIIHRIDGPDDQLEYIKANHCPYYDKGIIALDATTPVSREVNCVVLEDDFLA